MSAPQTDSSAGQPPDTLRLHAPGARGGDLQAVREAEEHLDAIVQMCFARGPAEGRKLIAALKRGVLSAAAEGERP